MRTMRFVPSTLLVLSILGGAFCIGGCADDSQGAYELAGSTSSEDAKTKTAVETSKPVQSASSFSIHGSVNDTDMAGQASKVRVLALAADGTTTPVTTANVNSDGSFTASNLSGSQSPTGLFILSLENIGQDVIGSGLVNGALPLAKGVVLDAPIDALTSLKTNVIQSIASGQAPNLQNYVNVVEAFVNPEMLNAVQLTDGLSTDSTTLIGGISDAVVAGENVIEDTLKKAGINIDFSALQGAQAQVVQGIDAGIGDGKTGVLTAGSTLVSGIESAISGFTGPVDQTVFNSVTTGGAAFSNTVKSSGAPDPVAFAASKSTFRLQTALSTSTIKNSFAQSNSSSDVSAALTQASQAFTDAVNGASSTDDLNTAKTNFMNTLLGNTTTTAGTTDPTGAAPQCCLLQLICCVFDDMKQIWYQFDQTIAPWTSKLTAAFGSCDYGQIGDVLSAFDKNTAGFETSLPGLDSGSAKAFSSAIRLVQKQIPQ